MQGGSHLFLFSGCINSPLAATVANHCLIPPVLPTERVAHGGRRRPTAVRDFQPAYVGFGSFASDRTLRPRGMSALPRKQTNCGEFRYVRFVPQPAHAVQQAAPLFDHLVGDCEQRR